MKSDTFYKVITKVSEIIEGVFLNILKAYLNTVAGQSFFKRFINFAVDNGYEYLLEPFVEAAVVRAGYKYDVQQGKILITKLHEAEAGNDQDTYDSTVDDILS